MNFLRFLLQVLLYLLKTLTYGWILNLIEIVKGFFAALKKFCKFLKQPHPVRDETDKDCSKIDNPSFHRPDPCIYSQPYLLKLGLPVTWDNPDIVLKKGGVIVPENALLPDTDYEIDATIWNNSYEAPVVGLKVHFSFLSFGVATDSHVIGTTFVTLGVKGGPNHPALAKMLWHTPATPGHFCIQANIEWYDDANQENNLGQNNVDVAVAQSPATFTFRLKNPTDKPNRFRFEVDTYSIPEPRECAITITRAERGTRAERLRLIKITHNRANFPVPAGWSVEILPNSVSLAVGEETDVMVKITPPNDFTGTKPFNVNALYNGNYAGGVSLLVSKT